MAKTDAERAKEYRDRKKAQEQAEQKKREARREANKKYAAAHPRSRNFATVIYPESAPEDWQEQLIQLHVAALVSPLHDRDLNPNGELKKPHWHVMVMFESPKDYDTQVKPIFDSLGAVGREEVFSARGYARYLTHKDNPEKAQYDEKDILSFGGADYYAITNMPTDDMKLLTDIFRFVRVNQIVSFAELLDFAAVHRPDWFSTIAMSRAYIVDKYIKSAAWEMGIDSPQKTSFIDPETGERLEIK